MPFMDVDRPSIQLGLLKAIAESYGFPVSTLHANLNFAARIGVDYYRTLAQHRGRLVGDWLFSVEAFGDEAPDPYGRMPDDLLVDDADRLRGIRAHDVPAFLDELMADVAWPELRVVAFSCTFQQSTASFALARRLKQRHPHLVTVFGGANFDGEMGPELVRTTDCVDIAVVGEGDTAFPRLLAALAAGTDPAAVPGVATRDGATAPAPPLTDLDDLPAPDYDEFFARSEDLGLLPRTGRRAVWIPFQAARGCWWGARHHCVFCGLNATTMAFRSRSPRRVLDELALQARRYRSFSFEAVDNILDMRYVRELFPAIVDSGADYQLYFEAKANLSRAQLKVLALGGVTHLQPGLESLSTTVLRLMDKGVRAIQNVNLLRWARYYGIHVDWNILWGFPGETAQEYADQAALVPRLVHLRPPASADRVWLERFSPLFAGTAHPVPERSYRYVYPDRVDLGRIAYFFEYEPSDALPDEAYDGLRGAVARWRDAWTPDPPVHTYWSSPGFVQIYDGRQPGHEGTYAFEGTLAEVYLSCSDRPMTAAAVRDRGLDLPVPAIEEVFGEFERRGLMVVDGNQALSLALPAVPGR